MACGSPDGQGGQRTPPFEGFAGAAPGFGGRGDVEPSKPERDAGGAVAGSFASDAGDARDAGDSGPGEPDLGSGCEPNSAPDAGSCLEICPETCNGKDDDCDGEYDGEAADDSCELGHAEALCDLGECLILECKGGYRDCDGEPDDGCEVAPTDPDNCGSCGKVCKLKHAIAACEDGQCVAIGCDDGYGDCDEDGKSCERSTRTLSDCGDCETPCGELLNATPSCAKGECEVDTCLGLHGDCNHVGSDGCEEKLDSFDHCSDCDTPCAKASCSGGVCTAVACVSPLADCDRDEADCEVDTSSDIDHCGGCDLPCAFTSNDPNATLSCQDSVCGAACEADYGDCDANYQNGCETPLLTTGAHCATCGNDCAQLLAHVATGSCSAGSCGVGSCDSGWEDCDGDPDNGCERNVAALGPCHPDTNCQKLVDGTREYHFCSNARSQSQARTRCRLQTRGDLVHIDDATENALLEANRVGEMWIGASDSLREATFRWLDDGVPFWKGAGSAGSAVLGRYANFDTDQPDDGGGAPGEDCVQITAGGTWNDRPCGEQRGGFVCEVRPDDCPSDASKLAPGQCGCGVSDTDADADSFAACADACESDPAKQAAGVCGCGAVEDLTNTDGDALADCVDGCDADPTQTGACFPFAPTSFDPNAIDWSAQPNAMLSCGTTTVDSTDPDGAGPLVATLSNWCGTQPTPIARAQNGGPELVIIPLQGLLVAGGNSLRLIGNRPVIIAVDGNLTITGTVDANASGATPGAGGDWSCGTSAGGNAALGSCVGGSEGGGGGGFGTAGGRGGDGVGSNTIGVAGLARGSSSIAPLYGGCRGGLGGGNGTDAAGGAGGGAVQLVASGALTVSGTVRANGGLGTDGSCGLGAGGGGGGSGGAIFFEASSVTTTGATITVNGGAGGYSGSAAPGGNGSTTGAGPGGAGWGDIFGGGGGGGGGYGRIRTLTH